MQGEVLTGMIQCSLFSPESELDTQGRSVNVSETSICGKNPLKGNNKRPQREGRLAPSSPAPENLPKNLNSISRMLNGDNAPASLARFPILRQKKNRILDGN